VTSSAFSAARPVANRDSGNVKIPGPGWPSCTETGCLSWLAKKLNGARLSFTLPETNYSWHVAASWSLAQVPDWSSHRALATRHDLGGSSPDRETSAAIWPPEDEAGAAFSVGSRQPSGRLALLSHVGRRVARMGHLRGIRRADV